MREQNYGRIVMTTSPTDLNLGQDATVEDIADNYAKIADLTGAKPGSMLQLGA